MKNTLLAALFASFSKEVLFFTSTNFESCLKRWSLKMGSFSSLKNVDYSFCEKSLQVMIYRQKGSLEEHLDEACNQMNIFHFFQLFKTALLNIYPVRIYKNNPAYQLSQESIAFEISKFAKDIKLMQSKVRALSLS